MTAPYGGFAEQARAVLTEAEHAPTPQVARQLYRLEGPPAAAAVQGI